MTDPEESPPGTQLTTTAVTDLIENQKRELEIRAGELQLKAQQDKHSYEHAGKILEAQERDRKDQRQFALRSTKHRYWFVAGILIVIVGFIFGLSAIGKDQLAGEIIRAVVYLGAGAIGGFFYGKNKSPKDFKQGGGDDSPSR